MRCPTLAELPPPPPGKTGWPWTAESEQLPDEMPVLSESAEPDDRPRTTDDTSSSIVHRPSSRAWPRVSIVTPSYNQAQFIEETIRSVLLQGYPDLEYIIIDGGSTDGSVEVIQKYEPWLAYWVSEKDSGQSEAINKGFARATGQVTAWLNSDDHYEPNTLAHVVAEMVRTDADILYGNCRLVRRDGILIRLITPPQVTLRNLISHWERKDGMPPQPAVFFRRSLLDRVGLLRRDLNYAMDYDLWLRMTGAGFQLHYLNSTLATYVVHESSKTSEGWRGFHKEWHALNMPYRRQFSLAQRLRWAWSEWQHFQVRLPAREKQKALFEDAWENPDRLWLIEHLFVSLVTKPRLLFDLGILSLIAKALLGNKVHGWLKTLVRTPNRG